MPLMTKLIATTAVACTLLAAPTSAREVDRQEVAERFDEQTPRESYTYCADTQLFTLADGTQYRACVDWRAQTRTRLVRTYAILDGPDADTDENLDLARDCFDIAVASRNDPYRKLFDRDRFLAEARAAFAQCNLSRSLQRANTYNLDLKDTAVWTGGSRPQNTNGVTQ